MQGALFFFLLSAASLEDIRHREIADWLSGGIALLSLLDFQIRNVWGMLPAILLFAAAMSGGIGGGDVKLSAACGLVLGLPFSLRGMILGLSALLLFHLCASLVLCVQRKRPLKSYPMAPFLAVGYGMVYCWKIGGVL